MTRRGVFLAAGAVLTIRHTAARANTEGPGVYRGNVARTGVINDLGPAKTPSEKWFFDTGVSVSATPQIVASSVYVGDLNGTMWALSAEDGHALWRHETGAPIWSAAAIHDGLVFFGNETGVLFALSAASGERLWEFSTDENLQPSPLVIDDLVYAAGWDGFLYALDRGTGAERWSVELGVMVEASLTYADGRLYLPTDSVQALDARTGDVIWTFEKGSGIASITAAFSNGLLYIVGFGELFAINAADGSLAWEVMLGEYSYPAPAVAHGLVITTSEGLEFDTAKMAWTVHAFDAVTGVPVWDYAAADGVWADPVVAGEVLYMSDISGGVYALRATDGTELWRYAMETAQTGQLNVSNGSLFIAASDGVLALA